MEIIKKFDLKIKEFFEAKQNKKAGFILILGCIGITFIFLSELFPENKDKNSLVKERNLSEISEKESELEKRIGEAVSKIKGAGRTNVVITFESSDEYFYAKNNASDYDQNGESNEFEFVIIEGENGEEPLLIKKKEAEIRGVLVICDGGKDPFVREKILEAVCALLDISSNKVSVAEMA